MRTFLYYLYGRLLLRQVRGRDVPRHLGIILDGNRRYALERGVPDLREAYALGAEKLDEVLEWCAEIGIRAVSLWVFSTDNFHRSATEVSGILSAVESKLIRLAQHPSSPPWGLACAASASPISCRARPPRGLRRPRRPPRGTGRWASRSRSATAARRHSSARGTR